jgi:hypothetical protein
MEATAARRMGPGDAGPAQGANAAIGVLVPGPRKRTGPRGRTEGTFAEEDVVVLIT